MKRFLMFLGFVMVLALLLVLTSRPTQALPEYSTQTGEPCATCHISPSGGGLRTPRGQAWVADGKPGAVLELTEALALLGVELDVEESDYTAVPDSIPEAEPVPVEAGQSATVHNWLQNYQGN